MVISVFKTSLEEKDLRNIENALIKISGIRRWNTDLEDCDNILRIESNKDLSNEIIKTLAKEGFEIEELED
ncbi:MAG: hypothetical protein P8N69_01960 [Flavobacteriales bacterium]|nr:hypothetical protein [Flavobacteriales bacterium]